MLKSELIHFYSSATKTSLELPVGWELGSESERSVNYVDLDEDDESRSARLVISIQAAPDRADVRTGLVDLIIAGLTGAQVATRSQMTVDGVPAEMVVASYVDPNLGPSVQVHAVIQLDDVVWSVAGISPEERAERDRPVFEQAIASIRLVLP